MKRIQYRDFNSTRQFGIELELSNTVPKHKIKKYIRAICLKTVAISERVPTVNNNFWHIKEDASCGPRGFDGPSGYEVASYVGSGRKDVRHMGDVADALRKRGVEVTNHCGLHIHANASDLSVKQVGTIIAYWLKIESILGMALPSRRRSNEFCQFMDNRCRWRVDHERSHSATQIWDLYKPQNLAGPDNMDRRVNLNLVNYANGLWNSAWDVRRTLELRWPEGTVEGRDVKNWLRLFLTFIDNVKNKEMPKDTRPAPLHHALSILGLHGEMGDPDCFNILSADMMETKTWLLERICWYMRWEVGQYNRATAATMVEKATDCLNWMWSPYKKYVTRTGK